MVEKTVRNFGKVQDVVNIPDLVAIQRKSYDQFLQLDVAPTKRKDFGLEGLFREVGLDPCHVILEITETAAVADMTAARRTLETLTELGCRFALDDFGVGFTSFAYLKQLPVDYIKIDGAFIRNLSRHSDDRFLVKAMAEVSRGLGKKTVAEFVEQEACLDLLRRYGVDLAQGYFIGRPQPWTDQFRA